MAFLPGMAKSGARTGNPSGMATSGARPGNPSAPIGAMAQTPMSSRVGMRGGRFTPMQRNAQAIGGVKPY